MEPVPATINVTSKHPAPVTMATRASPEGPTGAKRQRITNAINNNNELELGKLQPEPVGAEGPESGAGGPIAILPSDGDSGLKIEGAAGAGGGGENSGTAGAGKTFPPDDEYDEYGNYVGKKDKEEGQVSVKVEEEDSKTETEEEEEDLQIPCHVSGCTTVFKSEADLYYHNKLRHINACSQCKRSMPNPHLLELHVLESHDSFFAVQAERKPMYSCFLSNCTEKLKDPDQRYEHCITAHSMNKKFIFYFEYKAFRSQLDLEKRFPKKAIAAAGDGELMEMGEDLAPVLPVKPRHQAQQTGKSTKHISFGRHVGKFIPNQVFAMNKPKKVTPPSTNDTEMANLDELKDALES